jgi:succinate-semialdehyde dehydrogenase/glutarate-semialdehyde dehydrogenase
MIFKVIVPYNFPIWMPFKSALGAIMIGNSIIMKHSTIVPQCALALENAFAEA